MNKMKKMLAVVLTAALMVPSMGVAAATSPKKTDITNKAPSITKEYTGANQTLVITIDGKQLVEGTDFTVVGTEPTAVGTHTIQIAGVGLYTGTATVTYTITKADKPVVTVSTKAVTAAKKGFTVKSLKKKAKTIKLGVKSPVKTKITYTVKVKKALKKYITVSKTGKVTLKKGAKKGTYKVVINVKGTKSFKGGKKTITIKVK